MSPARRAVLSIPLSALLASCQDTTPPTAPGEQAVAAKFAITGFDLVAVSGGLHHTCGVAKDGLAYCWGAYGQGQLGDALLG